MARKKSGQAETEQTIYDGGDVAMADPPAGTVTDATAGIAVETESPWPRLAEQPPEEAPSAEPPADAPAVDGAGDVPPLTSDTAVAPSPIIANVVTHHDDPLRTKLFELYDELNRCKSHETTVAASHKAAKADTEEAQEAVNNHIRTMRRESEPNLFTMSLPSKSGLAPSDVGGAASPLGTAPSEDWRTVALSTLDLSGPILEKLDAHNPPLRTIGDVADWTAKNRMLTYVNGIGLAKAEKVQAAMDRWFAEHPGAGTLLGNASEIAEAAAGASESEAPAELGTEPVVESDAEGATDTVTP